MSNLTSPTFDTPGTRYCGAMPRWWARHRYAWGGRGRALVMGVVVGRGVALCYDILVSGRERKKARHHTEECT